MAVNTFITAGGRIGGDFAKRAGTEIKTLVSIGGKTMLRRTIEALRNSENIGKIALIAPEELRNHPETDGIDDFIPASASGGENILKGLQHFKDERYVVLCTSDLPFISSKAIDDYLSRCPEGAALCYPIYERNEINPEIREGIPSYIKLKDGEFTGGSIFRLRPDVLIPKIEEITKSFNARKSAIKMAQLLGFKILFKIMTGTCRVDEILERASKILNCPCSAIRGCDPVLTVDVDDEWSYDFARKYIEKSEA